MGCVQSVPKPVQETGQGQPAKNPAPCQSGGVAASEASTVRKIPSLKSVQEWFADKPAPRRRGVQEFASAVVRKIPSLRGGTVLESCMRGKKTDLQRARRAASRIRDPSYTCQEFYEDIIAAFPELELYLVGDTISGRTGEDEYQRTLGAMFAFFWLMRLDLDGKNSFCFGLDENWEPRQEPMRHTKSAKDEWSRRSKFHKEAEWESLEQLLVNAGLLDEVPEVTEAKLGTMQRVLSASKRTRPRRKHDADRTLAMLVLTAFHDIMKTRPLLPTVSGEHGAFRGYKAGEVINDHDAALAYILEYQPSVLPSYRALPREQQESIKFTQSQLEYNMGWLVQAEAPPGALFRKFRSVVTSGCASPRDLAFYFTHWFTDLAGAEPFPSDGCEKLVLKFPKEVMNQFLLSFSIVQKISLPGATETCVLEDYLVWRWENHSPSLGPAPRGIGSIAKMRLVVMAQGDSAAVLRSFDGLPADDREVLSREMSMVDCRGQAYTREVSRGGARGPSILVYYGPALMQKAGREDPSGALMLLADVYRQARSLWPFSGDDASEFVSVRIDQLKELKLEDVEKPPEGTAWVLEKLSPREAAAQSAPLSLVRDAARAAAHRVITLRRRPGSVRSTLVLDKL